MSQQPPATVAPGQENQTLKFYFTPREALAGEMERLRSENPGAKPSTYLPDLADDLRARFGDAVGEVTLYAGETTVYLDRAALLDVCRYLYDEVGFTYLVDVLSIDRFTETDRFEVGYNLVSIRDRKRLRLKVRVDEDDPVVPSVTGIWKGANWHEREAWDMMGIRFSGHPDHRRIYMPEDFDYHPCRKEFPTLGIPGSLPLPPNEADGALIADPFPRAHGELPAD
jgi:NADH-quinone oxidoreductase subunit C